MEQKPKLIKFKNRQNPGSTFDIIQLEELLVRENMDHHPFDPHRVEFFMITLITKGKGKHVIDFLEYPYEKGTLITIRKDQLHKFVRAKNVEGFILIFTYDFLVSYLEELEFKKNLQLFNELLASPKLQLTETEYYEIFPLIDRIKKEYLSINDEYSPRIIRSELNILITKLFRIKSRGNPVIRSRKHLSEFLAFQELLEENVSQYSQVNYYAKELGISTKTLNNITRGIINKSAKEFIDEIYIKQIKRHLINTEDSVKETAYTLGFDEPTNFYKYFKRHTSLTPEQFRSGQV